MGLQHAAPDPHAALQPLCSVVFKERHSYFLWAMNLTIQFSYGECLLSCFLHNCIRPSCEIPEAKENVCMCVCSQTIHTHTHRSRSSNSHSLCHSDTRSEIRARSREADGKWLCWRTVETVETQSFSGHSCSVISAAASWSEQKLQLVCTELEFLCPPPLWPALTLTKLNTHHLLSGPDQHLISTWSNLMFDPEFMRLHLNIIKNYSFNILCSVQHEMWRSVRTPC